MHDPACVGRDDRTARRGNQSGVETNVEVLNNRRNRRLPRFHIDVARRNDAAHDAGRTQEPGQLACEKSLEAAVSKVATLTAQPFGVLINDRLAPPSAPSTLVGRAPVLDAVDRRLAAIAEASPGLVLRGAPASGRSALAETNQIKMIFKTILKLLM